MMSREKTFIIVLDDLPAKLSYANYGNININTPEPQFTNHSRTSNTKRKKCVIVWSVFGEHGMHLQYLSASK